MQEINRILLEENVSRENIDDEYSNFCALSRCEARLDHIIVKNSDSITTITIELTFENVSRK